MQGFEILVEKVIDSVVFFFFLLLPLFFLCFWLVAVL